MIYSHCIRSKCYNYNYLGINILQSESSKFDVYDCLTNTKISEFKIEANPFYDGCIQMEFEINPSISPRGFKICGIVPIKFGDIDNIVVLKNYIVTSTYEMNIARR